MAGLEMVDVLGHGLNLKLLLMVQPTPCMASISMLVCVCVCEWEAKKCYEQKVQLGLVETLLVLKMLS